MSSRQYARSSCRLCSYTALCSTTDTTDTTDTTEYKTPLGAARLAACLPSMPCLSVMYFFSVNLRGGQGRHGRPARAYRPEHTSQLAEAGRGWRPAEAGGRPRLEAGRGWRPAEAGGRPAHELAPAGRARGRMGRRLWAEAFHIGAWTGCPSTGSPPRTARLGRPCALPSHPRLR